MEGCATQLDQWPSQIRALPPYLLVTGLFIHSPFGEDAVCNLRADSGSAVLILGLGLRIWRRDRGYRK